MQPVSPKACSLWFPTLQPSRGPNQARQDERLQADVRRSGRATVKESLLDAFAERGEQPVPSMAGLTWLVGGAEAGGAQAEKVMRSAFTVLDDNLVHLRAQYAQARPSPRPKP